MFGATTVSVIPCNGNVQVTLKKNSEKNTCLACTESDGISDFSDTGLHFSAVGCPISVDFISTIGTIVPYSLHRNVAHHHQYTSSPTIPTHTPFHSSRAWAFFIWPSKNTFDLAQDVFLGQQKVTSHPPPIQFSYKLRCAVAFESPNINEIALLLLRALQGDGSYSLSRSKNYIFSHCANIAWTGFSPFNC